MKHISSLKISTAGIISDDFPTQIKFSKNYSEFIFLLRCMLLVIQLDTSSLFQDQIFYAALTCQLFLSLRNLSRFFRQLKATLIQQYFKFEKKMFTFAL